MGEWPWSILKLRHGDLLQTVFWTLWASLWWWSCSLGQTSGWNPDVKCPWVTEPPCLLGGSERPVSPQCPAAEGHGRVHGHLPDSIPSSTISPRDSWAAAPSGRGALREECVQQLDQVAGFGAKGPHRTPHRMGVPRGVAWPNWGKIHAHTVNLWTRKIHHWHNTVYVPCHLRFDGWKTGYLTPDMVTWRGLKDSLNGKGTVDMLIAMLDFKEHIFNKVVPHLIQIDQ